MADRKERFKFITPVAVAIFPKLHKADTKWKAEGEYSVKQAFASDADGFYLNNGKDKTDLPAISEKLTEILDAFFVQQQADLTANKKAAKAKTLKRRDVFAAETNEEGEETGNLVIKASMKASGVSKATGKPWKRSPTVFDAKGKKLNPVPAIYGGSEVKVAVEVEPYYSANDNIVGIKFYLDAVQLLKLVSGNSRSASQYGFGEEEGFTDDSEESSEQFGGGDGAEGGTATPAGAADEF